MSELDISEVFITRKMLIEEDGHTYFDEVKLRSCEKLCVFCGEPMIFQRDILPSVGGATPGLHHEVCRQRGWKEE